MAYMIWDVENAEEVDTYVNNYFETREEAVAFLNQMIEDDTGYYPFREEDVTLFHPTLRLEDSRILVLNATGDYH